MLTCSGHSVRHKPLGLVCQVSSTGVMLIENEVHSMCKVRLCEHGMGVYKVQIRNSARKMSHPTVESINLHVEPAVTSVENGVQDKGGISRPATVGG